MVELLDNALKFAKPGVKPRVRIWAQRRSLAVRLWVEDNGIGIEPRYFERIFGVFEQVHPSGHANGTGIGLAIVKQGMQRLGGDAGVESEPGVGSRFWVEFPEQLGGAAGGTMPKPGLLTADERTIKTVLSEACGE